MRETKPKDLGYFFLRYNDDHRFGVVAIRNVPHKGGVHVSASLCSPKDQFNTKIGVQIAVGKTNSATIGYVDFAMDGSRIVVPGETTFVPYGATPHIFLEVFRALRGRPGNGKASTLAQLLNQHTGKQCRKQLVDKVGKKYTYNYIRWVPIPQAKFERLLKDFDPARFAHILDNTGEVVAALPVDEDNPIVTVPDPVAAVHTAFKKLDELEATRDRIGKLLDNFISEQADRIGPTVEVTVDDQPLVVEDEPTPEVIPEEPIVLDLGTENDMVFEIQPVGEAISATTITLEEAQKTDPDAEACWVCGGVVASDETALRGSYGSRHLGCEDAPFPDDPIEALDDLELPIPQLPISGSVVVAGAELRGDDWQLISPLTKKDELSLDKPPGFVSYGAVRPHYKDDYDGHTE